MLVLELATALAADAEEPPLPRGHLEPFGAWAEGTPVEERADVPEPRELYDRYCASDDGQGRPVVFRGAASAMAATRKWRTDDYLLQHYGSEKVTGVEYNLKETRAGGMVEGVSTMRQFLSKYNTTDIYMVSKVPAGMLQDVEFLPCLRCGGYLNFLDSHTLWIGRGGSKSVVHYDDQDNMNCMLSGRKRFTFMHPSYKAKFEAHPNSPKNEFGWVDADLDRSVAGYGGFMGKIDVDRMDLIGYPGWRDVEWSYADLESGDCVFIPYQWYHQVTAFPGRSINVHIWYFRPARFDDATCDRLSPTETTAPTFADCTWGYEPERGHLGFIDKAGASPTRCGVRGQGPPSGRGRRRRRSMSQTPEL